MFSSMQPSKFFKDPSIEIVIGILLFVLGTILFNDAYKRRGTGTPWWSGPFNWM